MWFVMLLCMHVRMYNCDVCVCVCVCLRVCLCVCMHIRSTCLVVCLQ